MQCECRADEDELCVPKEKKDQENSKRNIDMTDWFGQEAM